MNNRTENGRTLANTEVVAADAIARLAGVSGKDVTKVLLAIAALHTATGHEPRVLIDIDAIPTTGPDSVRFDATSEFIDTLIHKLQKDRSALALLDQLNVHRRFGRPTNPGKTTLRSVHGPLRTYPD